MTTFTMDLGDLKYYEFKTKKDWDAYMAPFLAIPKRVYIPQPLLTKPERFPCLMIFDDRYTIENRHMNDQFPNFFVYNYTSNKEEPDDDYDHLGLQDGSDTTT